MPTKEEIAKIKDIIKRLHAVGSVHVATDYVIEISGGVPVWEGHVETFGLFDHAETPLCYIWKKSRDHEDEFVTVLQVPPIYSPQDAVRAHIARARNKPEIDGLPL